LAGNGRKQQDFAVGGFGEAVLSFGTGGEFGFADGEDFGAVGEAVAVVVELAADGRCVSGRGILGE
jgi:hypothetical protein